MTAWAYLAFHDIAAFAAGVILIETDHPWWAALCFVSLFLTTITAGGRPLGTR